ncbi:MAG: LamG-like jellyroll fold domain-containing protein, partial [Caldilineaceae bacterium]
PDPRPRLLSANFGMLSLNGSGDYVEVSNPPPLIVGNSFTFMAWVRRSPSVGAEQVIFDSGQQRGAWYVYISSEDDKLAIVETQLGASSTESIPADGAFRHVAVVKNGDAGNNITFYVDGVAAGTGAIGALRPMSGTILIGSSNFFGYSFDGDIDDVRLYNRALSANEVLGMAGGSGCATDGLSWATAFRDLSCALDRDITGDQIWVGEGHYRPGVSDLSTYVINQGISLYGGFLGRSPGGGETAISQRPFFDPDAPLTILSGDLRGDDTPANPALRADNAGPVIFAATGRGFTLDGFGVRDGEGGTGAGMQIIDANVSTLRNLALTNHRTDGNGGAIYTLGPLTIEDVHARFNQAFRGGAIYAGSSAEVEIRWSFFFSNTASSDGGAIYSEAPLTVTNSYFETNTATFGSGGAITL